MKLRNIAKKENKPLNINLRNKYTENNNYNYTMLVKYIFII